MKHLLLLRMRPVSAHEATRKPALDNNVCDIDALVSQGVTGVCGIQGKYLSFTLVVALSKVHLNHGSSIY